MRVEIWSDVVCPWCFIGKRRFETAVASFEHPIEVVWRSYELDRSAPPVRQGSSAERIARKYGMTVEEAAASQERITDLAAAEGLDYHLDRARSGRTFDAHRLLHLAGERGVQDAVKERLLAGYLEEGVAIGLPEELAPLAVAAGLDADEVDAVLSGDALRRCGAGRRGQSRWSSASPGCRSSSSTGASPSPEPRTRTPSSPC